jgi:hypothetical protein
MASSLEKIKAWLAEPVPGSSNSPGAQQDWWKDKSIEKEGFRSVEVSWDCCAGNKKTTLKVTP